VAKTKFFQKYQNEVQNYLLSYSKEERSDASIGATIGFVIIALPIILIEVNLFELLIMRIYLDYVIAGLVALWLALIYFLLFDTALKKIKKIEGLSYSRIMWTRYLITALIIIAFIILVGIFTIQLFLT